MSKKKKLKAQTEVAELLKLQADSLQGIEDQIAAADAITDPSEKIIKLQELQTSIKYEAADVSSQQSFIVNRRAEAKTFAVRRWWNAGAPYGKRVKAQKQLLEQNPALGDFKYKNKAQQDRVSDLLDVTARTCDLAEAARSPWFGMAFKETETLRDRFAAAAAAKQALGDNPSPAAEKPAAEQRAAAPKEAGEKPAKVVKRDSSHLDGF